jgi:3-isopropylmalate dehydrogenase
MIMKRTIKVAVLPGDGVGPEVIAEAVNILRTVSDVTGCGLEFEEAPIGGVAIRGTGSPLPTATLDCCLACDAVLLGAVGAREFDILPQHQRPEAGLLQLRLALGGFANLRPARAHTALVARSPFRPEVVAGVDVLIVRELLGGLYFGEPRGIHEGDSRSAFNTMRYSEEQIERVARVAFLEARQRRKHVTSVDKANVLETSHLWRQVVTGVGLDFPDVKLEHVYVDACAMFLAVNPRRFDVILTENLFGDILSDQAASFAASLGMLPSATVGGEVDLYEPVHGSAPDIAGKNLANPIGAIASAAMLLRYTAGLHAEARYIEQALEQTLSAGFRTADIAEPGARVLGTSEMGSMIQNKVSDALHQHYAYHAV